MPHVVINTVEQCEAAAQEVCRLTGVSRNTPEDQMRIDLIAAIEIWDARQSAGSPLVDAWRKGTLARNCK